MALFDLPLKKLQAYNPTEKSPPDFDAFWKSTLTDSARFPLDPRFVQLTDPIYNLVDVHDLTFRGYMGQTVKGWFILPKNAAKPLPCLVSFIGYGGGRSLPLDHIAPAVAGFANLVMDTRGQGSSGSPGDTHDDAPSGPAYSGFMTRGILDRNTYFYRRVFTDAARAVDVARTHPLVDASRIGVTGGSQGGGISIAAAALAGKKVKLLMPDVPFLCHFTRAVTLVNTHPYAEIGHYLKCHRGHEEAVFKTLPYFDGMHFAPRVTARSLFSVALMDDICPPSTVYAAFNRLKTRQKEMRIYPFNYHEGGGVFQVTERLRYAKQWL